MENNTCILKLDHLVFDTITFQRIGFRQESKPDIKFGFDFDKSDDHQITVRIGAKGEKKDEYRFEVIISGYFTLQGQFERIDMIARQNAASIVFPYLRSQITLLTSQPEVEPVIVPPLNVAKIVSDSEQKRP